MRKIIIGTIVVGGLLVATTAGAQMLRGAYNEPDFDPVHTEKPFEIRRYEPRIVAKTTVKASSLRQATSMGFERLAGYIFGGNETPDGDSQKIAMTTPVESVPAGAGEFEVVFTMPSKWTLETLPKPKDPRVELEQLPAETVATARFAGNARDQNLEDLQEKLLEYVSAQGYVTTSEVTVAQYDPPWTPGFMRRNELMVNVSKPQ